MNYNLVASYKNNDIRKNADDAGILSDDSQFHN